MNTETWFEFSSFYFSPQTLEVSLEISNSLEMQLSVFPVVRKMYFLNATSRNKQNARKYHCLPNKRVIIWKEEREREREGEDILFLPHNCLLTQRPRSRKTQKTGGWPSIWGYCLLVLAEYHSPVTHSYLTSLLQSFRYSIIQKTSGKETWRKVATHYILEGQLPANKAL